MQEKSLQKLEYDKILAQLANYAGFALSREKILELQPSIYEQEAKQNLAETDEAREILRLYPAFTLGALWDIRAPLKHLEIGGILEAENLLHIADFCRAVRQTKSFFSELKGNYPQMSSIGHSLMILKSVESAVEKSIGADGQILDHASERLAQLRRRMRQASERVRERLDNLIRNPNTNRYLQDNIVTMREGRYVVPVKQEYRAQIAGVVHDMSSSGATLFIEPMAVMELNNELAQLGREEQAEIAAILRGLSLLINGFCAEIKANLQFMAHLDFLLAKGKLSHAMDGLAPKIVKGGAIRLNQARHPLIDPNLVVPIDIVLDNKQTAMIITGPNTGGKTVSLKTVGLLTAMALSGLHIPVDEGSIISVFSNILADIGDEQSIEQSLSTFSAHMVNIVDILDIADYQSLVLLDELGAGTDPTEGAALAMAILENLQKRGLRLVATTHYSELKAFAYNHPGFINASVEFDVATLSPTYRLLMGVPGKSNAFEISRRLGLTEHIIEAAGEFLSTEDAEVAALLSNLEDLRRQVAQEKEEAAKAAAIVTVREKKLHEANRQAEADKVKIIEKAHQDAKKILEDTLAKSKGIYQDIVAKAKTEQEATRAFQEAQRKLKTLKQQLEDELPKPIMAGSAPKNLSLGDYVYLPKLRQKGNVITLPLNGEVGVQIGAMKLKVKLDELRLSEPEPEKRPTMRKAATGSNIAFSKAQSVDMEVNLHGMDSLDALDTLDKYIDDAFIAGIKTVRINHGKGTGVLKKVVKDYLRKHRLVKSYRQGDYHEGGIGVTMAELDL